MSADSRKSLGDRLKEVGIKVGLGVLIGEKPKNALNTAVKEEVKEVVTDKLQDAGLPVLTDDKQRALNAAMANIRIAKEFVILGDENRVLDRLDAVIRELQAVIDG